MGVIARLYDFVAGTRIRSSQVDAEFDQLVLAHNTLNTELTTNYETIADLFTNRKLSATGDFTGTLNGLPITSTDPGLSSAFVALKADVAQRAINVCASPYNADRTGVIDCTTVIQAAVDALGVNGGTIIYPAGSYKHGRINMPNSNVKIIAIGKVTLIPNGEIKMFNVTGNDAYFENLFFDMPVYTGLAGGVNAHAIYAANVSNVTTFKCQFKEGGYGVSYVNVVNAKVIDCEAWNANQWSIVTTGCDGLWYIRNKSYNSKQYDGLKVAGVDTPSVAVSNKNIFVYFNECYGNARDGFDIATNDGENINICHNNFHDNTLNGIDFKIVYQGTSVNTCLISLNTLKNNLSQPINVQADFGTMEHIKISDNIINNASILAGIGIRLYNVSNVEVTGNKIYKNQYGMRIINSTNVLTEDNKLVGSQYGIQLEIQLAGVTTNCEVVRNHISANGVYPIYVKDAGCSGTKIIGNTLDTMGVDTYRISDSGTGTIKVRNISGYATTKPTGRATIGDIFLNSAPASNVYSEWVATSTGSSATFKGQGLIET